MPSNLSRPMLFEAATGRIKNTSVIHKFGRNSAIGTTFVPVAAGGVYQTPKGSAATALRIAAGGDANDTSNGSGARQVTVQGLDENGMFASEVITTNGVSASTATTTTFMRLYRAYVSASGTYATQSAGSHADTITIENSAGGTTWGVIDATSFPKAQTEIGVYSIADGYKGYVTSFSHPVIQPRPRISYCSSVRRYCLNQHPFRGCAPSLLDNQPGITRC